MFTIGTVLFCLATTVAAMVTCYKTFKWRPATDENFKIVDRLIAVTFLMLVVAFAAIRSSEFCPDDAKSCEVQVDTTAATRTGRGHGKLSP